MASSGSNITSPPLAIDGSKGPQSSGHRVRPSPNIWHSPAIYELENLGCDPADLLWQTMSSRVEWAGKTVLDIGCGTGFHLPRFAAVAATVIGVEPHPPLAALARRRTRRLPQVGVVEATAAALPLPAASVDVAHARWAYFFGPGAEPGLAELERVLRPGGIGFIIDNDPTRSTFGQWFQAGFPEYDATAVAHFWQEHGWHREPLLIAWEFENRADFEAVVHIELPTATATAVLEQHPDLTGVDYAVNLWWRRF